MLKRGGRSYDETGVKGTSPGELAVLCPACPIPSINLPPDWKSIGEDSECVEFYCGYLAPLSLIASVVGICTTKHLASMLASDSSDGRYQTTRRTQNLGLGTRTLWRGIRIVNTSNSSMIRTRFDLSHLSDGLN